MDCPHIPELGYGEFSLRLHEKIRNQRIPVAGSVELTFRCNLGCAHCYVACGNRGRADQAELSYQEICGILDQLSDEGCLWLLLTGGELFVRRDVLDIYIYAKRRGMFLSLFTNGTLLTPQVADYLAEWRPFEVEITLYGRTQETYERITGVPGSHARCLRGIELLLERGIPLRLKTMLMTLNRHELWDIKAYAESLGVGFRFDPLLNAELEGVCTPLQYRLSPKEIVAYDLADVGRRKELIDFCERYRDVRADPRYLYACGAGLNTFHIDPYGKLSICMMSRTQSYDLRQGGFREGWRDFLSQVRYQAPSGALACHECELLSLCGQCPGWAQLENGDPEKPVAFLCEVAHLRAEALEFGSH